MPDSGRTQRGLAVDTDAAPQRIDFGQSKSRTIAGISSARISAAGRPGVAMVA